MKFVAFWERVAKGSGVGVENAASKGSGMRTEGRVAVRGAKDQVGKNVEVKGGGNVQVARVPSWEAT